MPVIDGDLRNARENEFFNRKLPLADHSGGKVGGDERGVFKDKLVHAEVFIARKTRHHDFAPRQLERIEDARLAVIRPFARNRVKPGKSETKICPKKLPIELENPPIGDFSFFS